MIDPESLETQLHKMMQTILISFNDLHKQDPSTITPEQNQEKAKEIISLSKSLDQSIDQCHYLSNSVEDLDKEIALCLQEKKKKLEDFSEVFNEAGTY